MSSSLGGAMLVLVGFAIAIAWATGANDGRERLHRISGGSFCMGGDAQGALAAPSLPGRAGGVPAGAGLRAGGRRGYGVAAWLRGPAGRWWARSAVGPPLISLVSCLSRVELLLCSI